MKRMLTSLRRLQWKLTLSYTAVTTCVMLVLGVILFLPPLQTDMPLEVVELILLPHVQEIAAPLDNNPPDQPFLDEWVTRVFEDGNLAAADGMGNATAFPIHAMHVYDENGRKLTETRHNWVPGSLSYADSPQAEAFLNEMRQRQEQTTSVHSFANGQVTAVIFPLESLGRLVGLAVVEISNERVNDYIGGQLVTDDLSEMETAVSQSLHRQLLDVVPPLRVNDQDGAHLWLEHTFADGFLPLEGYEQPTYARLNTINLMDSNGRFVAGVGHGEVPESHIFAASDEGETILREIAQRGSSNEIWLDSFADNQIQALVFPVQQDNRLVGMVLVEISNWQTTTVWTARLRSIGELIGQWFIQLLLLSAVVGTLFGYLASRGWVRRLTTLGTAAEAWARGNFDVNVSEKSGDEIGILGRRLNQMAEQLETLVDTRKHIGALEERGRIARELHDAVKQQVFATQMHLSSARLLMEQDTVAAAKVLEDAIVLNQQTQDELAHLIRALHPAAVAEQGLTTAVHTYAQEWKKRTQIDITVLPQGERPLALYAEQALYRVIQEALNNVAKHAHASLVIILLIWLDSSVTVQIIDNGQGFEPKRQDSNGYGLHTMKERLAELDGTLEISSSTDEGTKVIATLPLYQA
ncbi:MAG: sensor histidine kinase [Chloroflexota bacterium]